MRYQPPSLAHIATRNLPLHCIRRPTCIRNVKAYARFVGCKSLSATGAFSPTRTLGRAELAKLPLGTHSSKEVTRQGPLLAQSGLSLQTPKSMQKSKAVSGSLQNLRTLFLRFDMAQRGQVTL